MATINVAKRRIDTKIVYYGPGQSGKTTNLVNVHARMPAELRGDLRSIDTAEERTLFFDFMPVEEIEVGGWAIRFHLYTVPGQKDYVRTRRAILGGADGIVFVADASPEQSDANRESVVELHEHLVHYGRDAERLPVVLQVNKTDLPQARDSREVNDDLNEATWPMFPAMAIRGIGVAETLGAIAKAVAWTL
ncbi:MAG TPA: ADP-ribosylation factor-like protein [Thermomicrobiales bacterium]|nr:ADP-ribosylation factor-like protein [Thermomicrobiales bacterium]